MIYVVALLGGIIAALLYVQQQREKAWHAERSLLLDRLMARSFEQFKAQTEPDAFLAANEWKPRRVLYDETGLLEVDLDDDEGVTSGDHAGG